MRWAPFSNWCIQSLVVPTDFSYKPRRALQAHPDGKCVQSRSGLQLSVTSITVSPTQTDPPQKWLQPCRNEAPPRVTTRVKKSRPPISTDWGFAPG